MLAEEFVKLLALDSRGVGDGQGTALADDLVGGVRSNQAFKAR